MTGQKVISTGTYVAMTGQKVISTGTYAVMTGQKVISTGTYAIMKGQKVISTGTYVVMKQSCFNYMKIFMVNKLFFSRKKICHYFTLLHLV